MVVSEELQIQKSWRRCRGSLRLKVSCHVGDTDGGLALLFAIRGTTARGKYGRELKATSWLQYTSDSPGGKWYWRDLIRCCELRNSSGRERARMELCNLIREENLEALGGGLIFTPISTLTGGVATS